MRWASDSKVHPQQTEDVHPILVYCWCSVYNAGPTINRHWVNVLCLFGLLLTYFITDKCFWQCQNTSYTGLSIYIREKIVFTHC